MKLKIIMIALAILSLAPSAALAQAVKGTLLGTVVDASGATVPNAKIAITESNTGIVRTTTTNESGNYNFPDLAPGTYVVTAEVTGFKRSSRAGVPFSS